MTDQKTMAYINMFGVLGALPMLCKLDSEAAALLTGKTPIALCLSVKNGPAATFTFADGGCTMEDGEQKCDIKIPFSTCEKFNGMIDGTVTPIPSKGFTKIGFLTGPFIKLTDRLSAYLRASESDLADERFFNVSTELMLYVIGGAVAAIGSYDKIGTFSASNIPDGIVHLSIKDGPCATITVRDHKLSAAPGRIGDPRAVMEFANIRLARALFDGKVNSMDCIGKQTITMRGMISMLDNINRILDRVSVYLA